MNILLIGMPGSGKTAIGSGIASKLNKSFLDIDELIISETGKDAAEHLAELGDDRFLLFEAGICQKVRVNNFIIASTGSVPLVREGIDYLRKNAFTVWLNPASEIIKNRIKNRVDGTSRIVGAHKMTLDEIIAWRIEAYRRNHDVCFELKKEMSREYTVGEIIKLLNNHGVI